MESYPRILKGPGQGVEELTRLPYDSAQFSEHWIQSLIFDHPELLPAREIDDDFDQLIAIGREIPVLSGSIDNLYISPKGKLCLVETKLWRNPEAHRTVLAQLLDYAKDLAQLDYRDLEERVKRYFQVRKSHYSSIFEVVTAKVQDENLDAISFEAELRRSLSTGDFLLLIVGDKIRPQVAMLAESVQAAPHLEFTIGLVELSLYYLGGDPWPLLVVPSLVGRTYEVSRGVIRIRYEEKKPEVDVSAVETPAQREAKPKTDLETFLKSVPSEMEDVFRTYLEKWLAGPYLVYWGTAGFSLRLLKGETHITVFDAYPSFISTFKKEWLKHWGNPEHLYRKYREKVDQVPAAISVISSGRRYIRPNSLSAEELEIILNATDEIVDGLANLNTKF